MSSNTRRSTNKGKSWFEKQPASIKSVVLGAIITGLCGILGTIIAGGYALANTFVANQIEATAPSIVNSNGSASEPVVIQLNQKPHTYINTFEGVLNQSIGLLEPSMIVNIESITCLQKRTAQGEFFSEISANLSDPYKTSISINVFAQSKPIIINSVNYINLGFLNFDETFIDKIYEPGGFGGGEPLDQFMGDGGNVRPDKSRTDLWGGAPSVRVESNHGVTLILPVQFSEPGVYSYSLEITGQDTNGTAYIINSETTSFGWLRMDLQPSSIEPPGPAWQYTLCK